MLYQQALPVRFNPTALEPEILIQIATVRHTSSCFQSEIECSRNVLLEKSSRAFASETGSVHLQSRFDVNLFHPMKEARWM